MPDFTIESFWMCGSNELWEAEVTSSSGKVYTVRFAPTFDPETLTSHGFSCTCPHWQHRLKSKGGECKHIERAKKLHCGWHENYGGDGPGEPIEGVVVKGPSFDSDGPSCPRCGGPTRAVLCAV